MKSLLAALPATPTRRHSSHATDPVVGIHGESTKAKKLRRYLQKITSNSSPASHSPSPSDNEDNDYQHEPDGDFERTQEVKEWTDEQQEQYVAAVAHEASPDPMQQAHQEKLVKIGKPMNKCL